MASNAATTPESELEIILRALAFAAHKHRDQRRKNRDASPHINHPIAVADVLVNVGGISDTSTLCAALLHDTLEDTETSIEELLGQFGPEVVAIVVEVSDDKNLPKQQRKQSQIEGASGLFDHAKQVKLADKICNLRDLKEHPLNGLAADTQA